MTGVLVFPVRDDYTHCLILRTHGVPNDPENGGERDTWVPLLISRLEFVAWQPTLSNRPRYIYITSNRDNRSST